VPVCDHLRVVALRTVDLGPALRELRARAATPAGQAAGVALILVPAVVHPARLGAADAAIEAVAALAGVAGALLVFGGLFQWVFLTPRPDPAGTDAAAAGDAAHTGGAAPEPVPHARAVWVGAVALAVVLAAGAVWRLVLMTGDGDAKLAEVLLLGLPAVALAAAAWAGRGVWSPGDGTAGAP
jgi:hypothetical protein